MKKEDKKKEEARYPEGEEKLIVGGVKNFGDFEIDKQMECLEDKLIEAAKEFIDLRNLIWYWRNN